MGIKEKVKQGKLSPRGALKMLRRIDDSPSPSIIRWLERRIQKEKR